MLRLDATALAAGLLAPLLRTTSTTILGLGLPQLFCLELIVLLSGVVSGLSGFGFSALGSASLLILEPIVHVPLFQMLSTANQLLSTGQLRHDMPRSPRELWAGPGPCMLGGALGVPAGIWLLSHLSAARLMVAFGMALTGYAAYCVSFTRRRGEARGFDGPLWGTLVGLLGGVVGGFTAFPGAAVVIWAGLRGLPKARHRAIVQPYIIMCQIYSSAMVACFHPSYMNQRFWLLFALTLPAVVPGTLAGLTLYKRISNAHFNHVTHLLLGLSGIAVLTKAIGAALLGADR